MYYRPTGVTVDVLDNPRIINLGGDVRLVAIVGLGPSTLTYVDEAVQRGTGSVDYLSAYSASDPVTGVTVSQAANTTGVTSGKLNYALISANGALYNTNSPSASVNGSGYITWAGTTDVPVAGDIYYVTYVASIPASQFAPYTYSDKADIRAKYGSENNSTGLLTVAGAIVLENGSQGVILCQASGSTYNAANYKAAIDKLKVKTNIEQLVIVFPKDTTRANQETLLTYAYSHVLQMTNAGNERGLVCGSPTSYYAADGFDTIGDTATSGTYIYRATILKNKNVIYVVPGRIRRTDESGVSMELDANFAAAAVAGLQVAQPLLVTPINGFSVAGITLEDDKWNEFEKRQLGAGNCTVLQSKGGVVTVFDFLTTDSTSADTTEPTIQSSTRLVKRTLRDSLYNTYTNKGKVVTPTTVRNVEATTAAILQGLVNGGNLYSYGRKDDPTTGEIKISAKQNPLEPREIVTTCAVKFLYPLKFISVSVSTFV